MKKRTLDDVMICPYCGSDNCYDFGEDEICFENDNKGHYSVDCHCINCNKDFRLVMNFEYNVTKAQVRK